MMNRGKMMCNQLIWRVDTSGILHHLRMKMVLFNMMRTMTMMFVLGRSLDMFTMIIATAMMMLMIMMIMIR